MAIRVKILVACHKPSPIPKNDMFMPIHVGSKASSIILDMQRDDDGDNISDKNYCYCELTALYWAWKNLSDVDVIGLCHYRRFFDFHKQCMRFLPDTIFSTSAIDELDFSMDEDSAQKVLGGGAVVAKANPFNCSLEQQYYMSHLSDDYNLLRKVFFETQSEPYQTAFVQVIEKGFELHPYNMFVMRKTDFDDYCAWLFGLLFDLDKRIDISSYSTYQKRIYGFMAERLLNVWLRANNKQLLERQIIMLDENNDNNGKKKYSPRKQLRFLWRYLKCRRLNRLYKRTL